MSAEKHPVFNFYTGDVWHIYVTLFNDDGSRMDVTALLAAGKIEWWLLSGTTRVLAADDIDYIDIDAAQGDIMIQVLAEDTLAVAPGRYEDRLRLVEDIGPRIKWEGAVFVKRGVPVVIP